MPRLPSPEPASGPAPRRLLSGTSAASLVVASMVGTGVFTTSGFTLADLHTPERVLAAWLVGGLIAAFGALSYGALARRLPESGGEYLFLSRTLHPSAGYVAGWISLVAGFSAPLAAAALAFGEYTKGWWPAGSPRIAASSLLLAAALVHGTSVRRGMSLHNLAVGLKLLVLAVFIGVAWSRFPIPAVGPALAPDRAVPPLSWPAFAVSLVWISYSYSGWNAAVYVGGEIRDPERNLPRALLGGCALVTVLYLVLNAIFLYAAPPAALAGKLEVGKIAAEALGGPRLGAFVAALIACVLVAHVSGMTMAGPRVSARMAADGCLPASLAPLSGPPRRALWLQTAMALAMLWLAAYDRLLTYIGFTLSLCTAAAVIGLIRLRLREGPSLRVPGWPWVPGLFLLSVLWSAAFAIHLRRAECLWGVAGIALGWVAWRLTRPTPSDPRLARPPEAQDDLRG